MLGNQDTLYEIIPIAEGLADEVDRLEKWFKQDYPESELRVICDFNSVLYVLKIRLEVLMGEEVTENRLFFRSKDIILAEKELKNESLMYGFIKLFNQEMRKQVQNAFNTHYLQEKQRLGLAS